MHSWSNSGFSRVLGFLVAGSGLYGACSPGFAPEAKTDLVRSEVDTCTGLSCANVANVTLADKTRVTGDSRTLRLINLAGAVVCENGFGQDLNPQGLSAAWADELIPAGISSSDDPSCTGTTDDGCVPRSNGVICPLTHDPRPLEAPGFVQPPTWSGNGRLDSIDWIVYQLDFNYFLGYRRFLLNRPAGKPKTGSTRLPAEQFWTIEPTKRTALLLELNQWRSQHPDTSFGIYMGFRLNDDPCTLAPGVDPPRLLSQSFSGLTSSFDPGDMCLAYKSIAPWFQFAHEIWLDNSSTTDVSLDTTVSPPLELSASLRNFLAFIDSEDYQASETLQRSVHFVGEAIPHYTEPTSPIQWDLSSLQRAPFAATQRFMENRCCCDRNTNPACECVKPVTRANGWCRSDNIPKITSVFPREVYVLLQGPRGTDDPADELTEEATTAVITNYIERGYIPVPWETWGQSTITSKVKDACDPRYNCQAPYLYVDKEQFFVCDTCVTNLDLTRIGTQDWHGVASASELTGNGYVEFTTEETNTDKVAGLSHGDSDETPTDIDFGVSLTMDGNVKVMESGADLGYFGSYSAGDVFRVELNDDQIIYSKNGVEFHAHSATPTLPLLFDCSLYQVGATLHDIKMTPEQPFWLDQVDVALDPSGHGLTRTGSANTWDAGAFSSAKIQGDGYVEFTSQETNTQKMAGLSHGNTNPRFTDIDFAIYLKQNGHVGVYEAGANMGDFGTFTTSDVFRVEVSGGVVTYKKNGATFYTSGVAPRFPLLFDTSLFNVGATITNPVIHQG